MKKLSFFARVALVLASMSLAMACSRLATTTAPTNGNAVATTPAAADDHSPSAQNPEDKMPRIRPEEAKKLVDEGKAVIIDVRGPEAYKISHIKGSLDYPLNKVEAGDFSGLPKGKRIIAYCT